MSNYKSSLRCKILPILFLLSITFTCVAAPQVSPGQVISVVTTDWNDDGLFDRAVLTESANGDNADLYLYLSRAQASGQEKMPLTLHKPDVAWLGELWGTQPSLSLNSKKSLLIHSENTGIGRHAWQQKLTVAWRKNHFVVAGYTYNSYDKLGKEAPVDCDLNLLTGKGTLNGKPLSATQLKAIKLKDWDDAAAQEVCTPAP